MWVARLTPVWGQLVAWLGTMCECRWPHSFGYWLSHCGEVGDDWAACLSSIVSKLSGLWRPRCRTLILQLLPYSIHLSHKATLNSVGEEIDSIFWWRRYKVRWPFLQPTAIFFSQGRVPAWDVFPYSFSIAKSMLCKVVFPLFMLFMADFLWL